ncbi:MAG: protease inhibitor I42 family protein [Gammaproteobacteria bacterium]|nr:protease inhibitor I42 family protein [Gammaproteobacteria bacterium]
MMLKKLILITSLLCATSTFAATPTPVFVSHKKPLLVTQNQAFQIELKSNPSTGYSWHWHATKGDENLLSLVSHKYSAPTNKKLVGAPGMEIWTFKAKNGNYAVNQVGHIVMDYARPWEKNTPPASRVTFIVIIKA